MGVTDLSIAWLNALMALMACSAHTWAAVVVPLRRERLYHEVVALLSFGYALAYGFLASGVIPPIDWSPFMRGVSLLAWPLVWVVPAIREVVVWREHRKATEFILAEARRVVSAAEVTAAVARASQR